MNGIPKETHKYKGGSYERKASTIHHAYSEPQGI